MTTETFFLPREVNRIDWTTPAEIYNLYRSLFIRNKNTPVFVPIRSMQFMAVLDRQEILFVDSQSYAVSGNTGGRMILLAWQYFNTAQRISLDEPVACEVVSYEMENSELQIRLVPEFLRAMVLIDERYRERMPEQKGVNIVQL